MACVVMAYGNIAHVVMAHSLSIYSYDLHTRWPAMVGWSFMLYPRRGDQYAGVMVRMWRCAIEAWERRGRRAVDLCLFFSAGVGKCLYVLIDTCMNVCIGMCIEICVDMCIVVCVGMRMDPFWQIHAVHCAD